MNTGTHTWQEIESQPEVWKAALDGFAASRSALESFLEQSAFAQIVAVGCGSTHYLAQAAAAALTCRTETPCRALPSSELWLFEDAVPKEGVLLLTISRSGTTTETLRAQERFRETNSGAVLNITCHPESPLAQGADFVLAAPAAQEQSVAQTRSFTSMLLLSLALTAVLAHDEAMLQQLGRLPSALQDLFASLDDLPHRVGSALSIRHLVFLGAGPLYGLANEAMLKTKEMSLSNSEAYHPLEFRHGPMSLVDEHTLVVALLSDSGLTEEVAVLRDMQELGARTLALAQDASVFVGWQPDHVIELHSGLDEWERGPLYLPPIQRLAFHRSVAKGLNPDEPRHLTAVVELGGGGT